MLPYSTIYSFFKENGLVPLAGLERKLGHFGLLHLCLYNGLKVLPLPWNTSEGLMDIGKKNIEEIEVLIKSDIDSRPLLALDKALLKAIEVDKLKE